MAQVETCAIASYINLARFLKAQVFIIGFIF